MKNDFDHQVKKIAEITGKTPGDVSANFVVSDKGLSSAFSAAKRIGYERAIHNGALKTSLALMSASAGALVLGFALTVAENAPLNGEITAGAAVGLTSLLTFPLSVLSLAVAGTAGITAAVENKVLKNKLESPRLQPSPA